MPVIQKTVSVTVRPVPIRHKEMKLTGYMEAMRGDEVDVVLDTGLNYGSAFTCNLSEIELIPGEWP